ncbi:MAG: hypothetical protein GY742_09360 [Hyphomicrobiales bacterium]|nr:hypothetical protein [Hyphomicrobiales bacterium]
MPNRLPAGHFASIRGTVIAGNTKAMKIRDYTMAVKVCRQVTARAPALSCQQDIVAITNRVWSLFESQ